MAIEVLYPAYLSAPSRSYSVVSKDSLREALVELSVRWLDGSKVLEPLLPAAAAFRSAWSFRTASKSAAGVISYVSGTLDRRRTKGGTYRQT